MVERRASNRKFVLTPDATARRVSSKKTLNAILGQAILLVAWPSLTKDMQAEPFCVGVV